MMNSRLANCFKLRRQLFQSPALASFGTVATAKNDLLPDHADVVVVGGGIIGTSVAYHLGKLGVSNVVLLERDQLTSGTTWHAA